MSISIILLLVAAGVLILPNLGGDEDEDENTDNRNQILGGPEGDNVKGTSGNDLIRTFLGNDTIDGGAGNDEIRAGDGDDVVMGGTGLDFIRGGAGNDKIYGNEDNDRIISDRGNDTADAGPGADVVRGGQGNDIIRGGYDVELDGNGNPIGTFNAADQLSGEVGNDTLYAWGGGSTMTGGGTIPQGQSDEDTLVLVTGQGDLDGGSQSDAYYVLANTRDDEITDAIIRGIDLGPVGAGGDEVVLTIDHGGVPGGTDMGVEVTYEDVPSDGVLGFGTLITVALTGPDAGDYDDQESARSSSRVVLPLNWPHPTAVSILRST